MNILVFSASSPSLTPPIKTSDYDDTSLDHTISDQSLANQIVVDDDDDDEDTIDVSSVAAEISKLQVNSSENIEAKIRPIRNFGQIKLIWSTEKCRLPDVKELINEDDIEDCAEIR